ncbi:MAG: hypothetical protein EOO52_04335 [Gammaproteobacteria bacterium]|nr:MAG: hypothetical protein EOO52_04335 [Gammaproteobacteria bacterium]
MTEKECYKSNLANADPLDWRYFKKSTAKTIAPLFLITAIMSQWYTSYNAADYYAHTPKQQGLNLDAIKAHASRLGDKGVMELKFTDLENLIRFNCKK